MGGSALTFAYSLRHLLTRRTQSLLTIGGIALVVFVFSATLMLAEGLRETLRSTGAPENVIVTRTGAENEIQSGIKREDVGVILTQPEVARDGSGESKATKDVVVVVTLKKRADGATSNVTVRGVTSGAREIRSGITLLAGRAPQVGTREVMVGKAVERKFVGTSLGEAVRLVGIDWQVVGIFDAGNSAFGSEIWGDADILMPAFRRDQFSSLTFRLAPGASFDALRSRLENDRRLAVAVTREQQFYESQSKLLALFIRTMGGFITAIFSLGAIIGAMITMYSAVANRVREIGILRALGFSRLAIFAAFAKECVLLGVIGGLLGLLAASSLMFVSFATTNFSTFADLSFGFRLTPSIFFCSLLFAALMGLLGGALPAWRAARLPIIGALHRT